MSLQKVCDSCAKVVKLDNYYEPVDATEAEWFTLNRNGTIHEDRDQEEDIPKVKLEFCTYNCVTKFVEENELE